MILRRQSTKKQRQGFLISWNTWSSNSPPARDVLAIISTNDRFGEEEGSPKSSGQLWPSRCSLMPVPADLNNDSVREVLTTFSAGSVSPTFRQHGAQHSSGNKQCPLGRETRETGVLASQALPPPKASQVSPRGADGNNRPAVCRRIEIQMGRLLCSQSTFYVCLSDYYTTGFRIVSPRRRFYSFFFTRSDGHHTCHPGCGSFYLCAPDKQTIWTATVLLEIPTDINWKVCHFWGASVNPDSPKKPLVSHQVPPEAQWEDWAIKWCCQDTYESNLSPWLTSASCWQSLD